MGDIYPLAVSAWGICRWNIIVRHLLGLSLPSFLLLGHSMTCVIPLGAGVTHCYKDLVMTGQLELLLRLSTSCSFGKIGQTSPCRRVWQWLWGVYALTQTRS